MGEFKAWLWDVLIEMGLSFVAIAIIIGFLWGLILTIKFFA